MAFPLNKETEAVSLPQPQRGIQTAPSHGATPPDGVAASGAGTRLLSQGDSAASPRESTPVARPARREARVPAGQTKDSAPSRSAAGKSATSEYPAHFTALLIVTGTAKTTGLVRAAHRAGCPKGSAHPPKPTETGHRRTTACEQEGVLSASLNMPTQHGAMHIEIEGITGGAHSSQSEQKSVPDSELCR